jgi:acyl carrier protein
MDATVRSEVVEALTDVAPEVDPSALDDAKPLRDQVELDSMDWLRFLTGLEAKLGVSVSEADYRDLVTLGDVVAYVARRKH